ncbi:MAG: hypothetical protein P8J32_07135 [bacterium]|nr:hypothetical protein [bacterium]
MKLKPDIKIISAAARNMVIGIREANAFGVGSASLELDITFYGVRIK